METATIAATSKAEPRTTSSSTPDLRLSYVGYLADAPKECGGAQNILSWFVLHDNPVLLVMSTSALQHHSTARFGAKPANSNPPSTTDALHRLAGMRRKNRDIHAAVPSDTGREHNN